MQKNDIKIFCSHRTDMKNEVFDNKLYIPIRCGAFFDENKNPHVKLGDDSGDNISRKKALYSELTVLYWAWKNQTADYMGLCHYRRLFSCAKDNTNFVQGNCHSNGCLSAEILDKNTVKKYVMDEESLSKEIKGYDAVFIKPIDLRDYKLKSNYQAMSEAKSWHVMSDVDIAIKIIKEKYPQMSDVVDEYMYNYNYSYLYNCFVMKKELFNEYCSWLFDILFEVEKRIDCTNYSERQTRAVGLIGEHILGVWILWLKKQKKYKINDLPLLFVENTKVVEDLYPAFSENYSVIAASSSKEYVPYLSVYLTSIVKNANKNKNYDIIIFERNIPDQQKKLLKEYVEADNISLRFVNPMRILLDYGDLKFPKHYNLECYFRLTAPLVLKNFKKIIFTDIDLVFRKDPALLYEIELGDYSLAACHDLIYTAFLNFPGLDWKEYAKDVLELNEPYDYCNTGVLLINCEKFRKNNISEILLKYCNEYQYRILEQDVLNKYFKSNILHIDYRWNFPVLNHLNENLIDFIPARFLPNYINAKNEPFIIHWTSKFKPWEMAAKEYGYVWWEYARYTPFYELLLKNLVFIENNGYKNQVKEAILYRKNILKYWIIKILYNFSFGKKRKYYKMKKNILRNKVNLGKAYRKN